MKRWIILAIMAAAAFAAAIAWKYLPVPSHNTDVAGAADLGLLLLDSDDGLSVLGVQDNSLAEQADIRPGDVLMRINDTSLSTAETLDSMLMNDRSNTLVFELQRGKNVLSVKISLAPIVY